MALDGELSVLYSALGSPLGVEIRVSDPKLAIQRLYKARTTDPDLAIIQIRRVPNDEFVLWLVKAGPVKREENAAEKA